MAYFRLKEHAQVIGDPKPEKLDAQDKPNKSGLKRGLSPKRAAENAQYEKEAREFVKGKKCAVFPDKDAKECHHMKGRCGKLLLDKRFWLPVSHAGHKKITENPKWAIEMGYSFSRLSK